MFLFNDLLICRECKQLEVDLDTGMVKGGALDFCGSKSSPKINGLGHRNN